jgi:phage baseplate assembly protein W
MAVQGYNNLVVGKTNADPYHKNFQPKTYKGFSTISSASKNGALYDLELIKQDLINHFHIKKGEKLENPTFGTIIWDMLFEPLTDQLKQLITNDVNVIINSDPRIKVLSSVITQVDKGIQLEFTLLYIPYNIQQSMQFTFDQDNGLI